LERPPIQPGERRHLTVLFCDLAGSSAIAAQLDPEEWRETVSDYHRAAAEAITRFGGHVAKYLGDGVMAFFGYPQAHDNDAERAVRAALAILESIARLNEQSQRPKLAARVGIDSGAVVVGAGVGKDADVFGDTPNIAARVQEAAAPGSVVVTADTHRLISGLFVVEERGAPALKGIQLSRQLYRVIQPSGVRGRLEAAAASHGLTPFVGREHELRLLMKRWESVLHSEGQVTLIIGEPGIGKSRLVARFHEEIATGPHTWIEAAAGAFFQTSPFYPVIEMLKQALGWRGDEPVEQQFTQLESVLETAGLKPADAIPLLAPLLSLPPSAKFPASSLPPEQQRRQLLSALVELALGFTRMQPTVMAIEDLHWADPSTLELIGLLAEHGAQARLLLLCAARREFRPRWPLRAHHTQITLNRLSAHDVRSIVGQVAARNALSEETIAAVVERTGGVPLFVEEMTRAVLESGDAKLTGRAIPATLHDSLMARLDRLGPAKEVIQVGAVLGNEFSYQLLHAVHPIAEDNLRGALRRLTEAELLYERGLAPEASYFFKHALIRDAAYEALLKSRRKELHRQVAHTIDEQFPALGESHPEVLARHWTEAGETEPAVAAWSRAGKTAEERNAFKEALESCQQALALIKTLPESPERDLRELELRHSVVGMHWVTSGYSAPETIDAMERDAALAEKTGNLVQLFRGVAGRWVNVHGAGDFAAADTLADQAFELALREGSPACLSVAHHLFMITRAREGNLTGVEQHFTAWLEFFESGGVPQYPGGNVGPFASAAINAWMMGRADLAREREASMIAAADMTNPFESAVVVFNRSFLHLCMGEFQRAEAFSAEALELSEKNRFPQFAAGARCVLGEARAHRGRASEGIELIRDGIAGFLKIGTSDPNPLASLALAQMLAGDIEGALASVEQPLQANSPVTRNRAIRLRGELRLRQGQMELAEPDFREAIALAQKIGAKVLELGATITLARLLDKKGRREEARSMLAEIYNWFTGGLDTFDLKEARALLDELEKHGPDK
jgi:class 3 adenylate cyclase/tetratricopeptide (TPR) repeat protein